MQIMNVTYQNHHQSSYWVKSSKMETIETDEFVDTILMKYECDSMFSELH